AGGTLANATVQAGTTITVGDSSSTLAGVTLDGTLDMASAASRLTVTSGMTLNGTILLGAADGSESSGLKAEGAQTWSGTGSVLFGGTINNWLQVSDGATLTLGAGLTVHGQSGQLTGTFVNQGTIDADLAGRPTGSTAAGTLILNGAGWANQG